MPIIMKNMAQVALPPEHKKEVLEQYLYQNRDGQIIRNYKYKDGIAYLPLNIRKLSAVAHLLNEPIVDMRSAGVEPSTPFVLNPAFTFRSHQTKPANDLVGFCMANNYAVLKAPCSCGKTVVLTYAAGMLGRKILVLVDMGSLQSQWAEAFQLVWNKKAQILDRNSTQFADVCIATFQLLHFNPDLVAAIKTHFGCLTLDEFHSTSSETRREVLLKMNNQYRIGCTATLMKKGYSNDVLTDMVADVSVSMTDPKALVAEVHFIDSGVSFYSNDPDDWGKITSKLGKNELRNKNVAALTVTKVKEGRKILLIGVTIESLLEIEKEVYKILPDCKLRVYIGSTNLKQDQALRDDLASGKLDVIATVKKADKGLDLPSLDCLISAKPGNNEAAVIQLVGRVVRPQEGKPTPEAYDFVDRGSLSDRFARNRRKWYLKLGYVVKKDIDK